MTDRLLALAVRATPGPWRWWTSCSFRRLSSDATGKDGDVLSGTTQRYDGHPDIIVSDADRDHIEACNPAAIAELCKAVKELQAERYTQVDSAFEQGRQLGMEQGRVIWLSLTSQCSEQAND